MDSVLSVSHWTEAAILLLGRGLPTLQARWQVLAAQMASLFCAPFEICCSDSRTIPVNKGRQLICSL